ncbi:MAG: class II fructose-bisphosphatase [Deltaproteobacteria bacterium]|nr:class II fructose-bisphosphatase [Deltaproteobacteria bacterium]
MAPPHIAERNLALELVRVTEAGAIAAARWMGRGDETHADEVAVNAIRSWLGRVDIRGTIVIGEGERDEAPMLYIGESVGTGNGPELDIAVDPLEGTTVTARGDNNAMSVIAAAEKGGFLNAPDTYMEKIAVGPIGKGKVGLEYSPTDNLRRLAEAKSCRVEDLTVIILDRPRHEALIGEVRQAGARIKLIRDGDVSAAIATCRPNSGVDILMGTGGAPEGVLAAAALRCFGGEIEGRLKFRNEGEKARAQKMGITDFSRIYQIQDLARGPVLFAATGVTQGDYLKGVVFFGGGCQTHSVVLRSYTGTRRYIESIHDLSRLPKDVSKTLAVES